MKFKKAANAEEAIEMAKATGNSYYWPHEDRQCGCAFPCGCVVYSEEIPTDEDDLPDSPALWDYCSQHKPK